MKFRPIMFQIPLKTSFQKNSHPQKTQYFIRENQYKHIIANDAQIASAYFI